MAVTILSTALSILRTPIPMLYIRMSTPEVNKVAKPTNLVGRKYWGS
jgi:hypothetical protein